MGQSHWHRYFLALSQFGWRLLLLRVGGLLLLGLRLLLLSLVSALQLATHHLRELGWELLHHHGVVEIHHLRVGVHHHHLLLSLEGCLFSIRRSGLVLGHLMLLLLWRHHHGHLVHHRTHHGLLHPVEHHWVHHTVRSHDKFGRGLHVGVVRRTLAVALLFSSQHFFWKA